ncbi:class I SAM-dependent methyltransferase [Candidatus Woesearchaeota archaeon]|nr:class I SAM-dependent methyltransferase [Candidatus Woesearchaeota archaeon]
MPLSKEENVVCNLCGANDYRVVYPKLRDASDTPLHEKYSASKGVLCTDQIVQCNKCSLVYINPRPTADLIVSACKKGKDETYVSQEKARLKTFSKELALIHNNAQKGKLLDIGCAAGYFVKIAQSHGWEVEGIEPNKWLCNYGNKKFGLSNKAITLEKAKFKIERFDVVTLWDVIEHVPDPIVTLKNVHRVLKPKGHIVLSTPDFDSIFSKMFRRRWWFLLSHHLFYFTPLTIKKMLFKSGFRVIKIKKHWQYMEIGYMIRMMKNLNKGFFLGSVFDLFEKVLNRVKLNNFMIPYYAGQMDIVARKTKRKQI